MNQITPTNDWTLGASQANELALGYLPELWAEARGMRPRRDLTDNLAVQMGSALEAFHVGWFEKQTGINVFSKQRKITGAGDDGRVQIASFIFEQPRDSQELIETAPVIEDSRPNTAGDAARADDAAPAGTAGEPSSIAVSQKQQQ